jgi:ferredoxin
MTAVRKIVEIDEELCDGCGQCVPACAEGAIEIIDGKAKIVADLLCDGLGACLGECPMGALEIVEREADGFDEEAVHVRLEQLKAESAKEKEETLPCGCPSSQLQSFASACTEQVESPAAVEMKSALSQWPIQITLIPPQAPFLEEADLLVAADCAPFVFPNFQRDFIQGRVVLVGCPKLDDVGSYIAKFTEIFKIRNIKSVTVPIIEVPCCSGLPMILKKAMEDAGKTVPTEVVVLSVKGEVLGRQPLQN